MTISEFLKPNLWSRDLAQLLRKLTDLPEDQSSIPSTSVGLHTTAPDIWHHLLVS